MGKSFKMLSLSSKNSLILQKEPEESRPSHIWWKRRVPSCIKKKSEVFWRLRFYSGCVCVWWRRTHSQELLMFFLSVAVPPPPPHHNVVVVEAPPHAATCCRRIFCQEKLLPPFPVTSFYTQTQHKKMKQGGPLPLPPSPTCLQYNEWQQELYWIIVWQDRLTQVFYEMATVSFFEITTFNLAKMRFYSELYGLLHIIEFLALEKALLADTALLFATVHCV